MKWIAYFAVLEFVCVGENSAVEKVSTTITN